MRASLGKAICVSGANLVASRFEVLPLDQHHLISTSYPTMDPDTAHPSKRPRLSTDRNTDDASRSPSPAPAPPLPSAPGPRASRIQKLYADAIDHILKTCNYPNFASCFPTPAREVPQSMKHLHESFCEKLGDRLHKNFDGIVEDRGVLKWLNELDRLIEEAKKEKTKTDARGGAKVAYAVEYTLFGPASRIC
jgi:hypothetical protein